MNTSQLSRKYTSKSSDWWHLLEGRLRIRQKNSIKHLTVERDKVTHSNSLSHTWWKAASFAKRGGGTCSCWLFLQLLVLSGWELTPTSVLAATLSSLIAKLALFQWDLPFVLYSSVFCIKVRFADSFVASSWKRSSLHGEEKPCRMFLAGKEQWSTVKMSSERKGMNVSDS